MFGFTAKSSVPRLNICQILMRYEFLFPLESQQNYFDYKAMADVKKCPDSDFHDWAPKKRAVPLVEQTQDILFWYPCQQYKYYKVAYNLNCCEKCNDMRLFSKYLAELLWGLYWGQMIFDLFCIWKQKQNQGQNLKIKPRKSLDLIDLKNGSAN